MVCVRLPLLFCCCSPCSCPFSVIQSIRPAEFDEDQVEYDADTDDDEAYVNDGHVAPLVQDESDDEPGFFV